MTDKERLDSIEKQKAKEVEKVKQLEIKEKMIKKQIRQKEDKRLSNIKHIIGGRVLEIVSESEDAMKQALTDCEGIPNKKDREKVLKELELIKADKGWKDFSGIKKK